MRKGSSAGARASRVGPSSRERIYAVIDERNRLVNEIVRMRAEGRGLACAENALQLLTRWWSTASWSRRAGLLKSAQWLIEIERKRLADGPENRAADNPGGSLGGSR